MITYLLVRWFGLICIGLLIYGQTFGFDFVFDDRIFICTNPYIKNLNNFHVMWHAFPMTRFIGMLSFAVNYYVNHLDPRGYHIFNFIIHLVAAGLVWALAGILLRIAKWPARKDWFAKEIPFIIAVLFLVHPCQTQAVTYITQRFESMATVFYLATMYFYLTARVSTIKNNRIWAYGLAGLSGILGILTKETIVTVPAMILAAEWILFPSKKNKIFYIVLIIGGIFVYLLFSALVHANLKIFLSSTPSESHDGDLLTPLRYLLTQMRVFLTFLKILVLPINQNLDYDYPASTGLFVPPLTFVGILVIGSMMVMINKLRRQLPLVSFGLAWVLITFSINLAPRSNVIFEHKLYLISFGFLLAFVVILASLIAHRATLFKILCCMVMLLAFSTFQRNKIWANELTLWEDVIKKSPQKSRVNSNLGRALGALGRNDEAIFYMSRSIAGSPNNITYENRGVMYSIQGRLTEALEDLNKSIAMDPKYPITYIKRAWVLQMLHRYPEAFNDIAYAIQLDQYFTDAYIERGMIWMHLGKLQEARGDFQQAITIDPSNSQALQLRTLVLKELSQK